MPEQEVVIRVEARVMGLRRPFIADRAVPVFARTAADESGAGAPVRLRDLIAHVVRQEVAAYRQRQEERRLIRVLSPAQLQEAAARGRVEMGGAREHAASEVSDEAAVATALQAFADGLYFVFLDREQQQDLDAQVWVRPGSTLTFIRLVALAGG